MKREHIIEIDGLGNDRSYWQCDCGIGGTCSSDVVELRAEEHIPANEGAWYRYPGGRKI